MHLFDHDVRGVRAHRVKKSLPGADFIFARVADGFADRLADVKRSFPRMAILGAGGGLFAAALKNVAGDVEVVQIDDAQELAGLSAARAPWAETRVSPEETPDFSPGAFDLIIGGMTLHRANDPVGVLTQMRLALKPDGLALVAAFGGQTLHELRASFAEAETEIEGGMSPRVAPMAEIRDMGGLLQRSGLALPVADVDRFEVLYETPLHLMRDLRAMGEANALSQRRHTFTRRSTILRAAQIYVENYARPDGRVVATFEIVFLTGWAPDETQPKPLRPGSATARLADALGTVETSAGEKAGE